MTKYSLKAQVENVFRYAVSGKQIYIAGRRNFRVLSEDKEVFKIEASDTFQNVICSRNYCLLPYTESYITGIYSKASNEFYAIEEVLGLDFDQNDRYFYGNMKSGFCKYDLPSNSQIWTLEYRIFNFHQNDNSIFGTSRNNRKKLFSFSKENGSKNWEFDFETIGALSVLPIINIKSDILYVFVKIDRNEGVIIGLDVNSGELVFQSSNQLEGDKVDFEKLPIVHNLSFINNNEIIGIYEYWVYVFDTLTSTIKVIDLKEYLLKNDIRELSSIGGVSKSENNFFLSGKQKMKFEIEDFSPMDFIIALNRETFEIEWKYPTQFITETAKCIGNKLFQRKSDDKLLIFEEK